MDLLNPWALLDTVFIVIKCNIIIIQRNCQTAICHSSVASGRPPTVGPPLLVCLDFLLPGNAKWNIPICVPTSHTDILWSSPSKPFSTFSPFKPLACPSMEATFILSPGPSFPTSPVLLKLPQSNHTHCSNPMSHVLLYLRHLRVSYVIWCK